MDHVLDVNTVGANTFLARLLTLRCHYSCNSQVKIRVVEMIKEALPPSSRLSFCNEPPDCSIKVLPTRVDPVKETFRMMLDLHIIFPTTGYFLGLSWHWIMPLGTPALIASKAREYPVRGIYPSVLMATVQLAASAGAALRVIIHAG